MTYLINEFWRPYEYGFVGHNKTQIIHLQDVFGVFGRDSCYSFMFIHRSC